ncbi:MAG: hypothetical protein J5966_08355 [Lachnospiraceae bacterium]|nr:hypothetical protein [Lachnospiraceae bacterium]
MRLYERYFADTDALNDDEVTALKNYNEETISLVKHYYMDIPLDICMYIEEFDNKYNAKLLGPKWHEYLLCSKIVDNTLSGITGLLLGKE